MRFSLFAVLSTLAAFAIVGAMPTDNLRARVVELDHQNSDGRPDDSSADLRARLEDFKVSEDWAVDPSRPSTDDSTGR